MNGNTYLHVPTYISGEFDVRKQFAAPYYWLNVSEKMRNKILVHVGTSNYLALYFIFIF